ncbi:MAG: FtsQ-type POTRA domain-containing protein [Clostridia bacterium]|nr:FtsQ-type POTRA domain-containing protein [Clostridia bacterium]
MAGLTQEELGRMLPERRRAYEKRRKKVRRNRIIFTSFVSILILLLTVLVLSLTVFFKIDTITVNGTSRYDTEQIISVSGIQKGKNLFLSSVNKAQEKISSQLTYLSEVTVTRKLPSTIVIEVVGSNADFCYQTSGGYALTDSNSKVLEIVNADAVPQTAAVIKTNGAFVAVVGEEIEVDKNKTDEQQQADKKELELLKSVLTAIDESKIKDITEINITTPTSIYLTYQNRFKLNLGNSLELTYKLKSAVEIIAKEDEISPTTSGEINLDNPGSAYVSPNDSK